MTDYYCNWCLGIKTTPEEQAWFKDVLKKLQELADLRDSNDGQDADIKKLEEELGELSKMLGENYEWITFEVFYESDHIYIDDDGGAGDQDQVVTLLQEYLRKFHPDQCIKYEWAFTASKHIPNAFGGGACFITAEKAEWLNTGHWLEEKEKEFKP